MKTYKMKKVILLLTGALILGGWMGFSSSGVNATKNKTGFSAEFVQIPKGTFQMGSSQTEKGHEQDETLHEVSISQVFEMQTTEVTQAQFLTVMDYNPSFYKTNKHCSSDFLEKNGKKLCPNNPVEYISWTEIQEFIKKLNDAGDGYHYRLPTEAEWERAARGGTQTVYSYGDDPSKISEYAWLNRTPVEASGTHATGRNKPNPYGLFDMHGNVWEWVQDWYTSNNSGNLKDPQGPNQGTSRVRRGGSFNDFAKDLRSANRAYYNPNERAVSLGFRLVRTEK